MWGVTERVARRRGYAGPMRDMPRQTAKDIYFSEYVTAPGFAAIVGGRQFVTALHCSQNCPFHSNSTVCRLRGVVTFAGAVTKEEFIGAFKRRSAGNPDLTAEEYLSPRRRTV